MDQLRGRLHYHGAPTNNAALPTGQRKPNLLWRENPKRLSFANGTKLEKARDVEGMVACLVAYRFEPLNILKRPEWLADSGSSQHVCNNINML